MPSKSEERFWVKKILQHIGIDNCDIIERERPDFLLTSQGEQIGIEVTGGAPETFMRGRKIKKTNHMYLAGLRELNQKQKTEGRIKNPKLEETIETAQWQKVENSISFWISDMVDIIKKKSEKCKKEGYALFDQNWLVIWDLMGEIYDEEYLSRIKDTFSRIAQKILAHSDFDQVFIQSNSYLFQITSVDVKISKIEWQQFNLE